MFKFQLPAPYPTFGAYMKQFGKNLIYAIPAFIITVLITWFVNVAIEKGVGTYN